MGEPGMGEPGTAVPSDDGERMRVPPGRRRWFPTHSDLYLARDLDHMRDFEDVIPFSACGFWNWEAETISLRHALIYVLANTGLLVDFDPSRASPSWNERHTTCI